MLLHKDLKETMKVEQIELAIQELLKQIDGTSRPANEVINSYTRMRRYIGSKDRRAITDGVWQNLRSRPTPDWIKKIIPENELLAMNETAKTVLRANGNRLEIQKELQSQDVDTDLTPISPIGLVLKKRVNLSGVKAYQDGLIEVQDEGSQLLALATKIKSGDKVLDYCAGAGGKSLAFAQMMQNQGQIVAHDVSAISLKKLQQRARRANVDIIRTTQKPQGLFDHVVVDAPCSGTGTWRRQPDARLKLKQEQIKKYVQTQAQILDKACQFVKPNGYLHYMTCSLLQDENQNQMKTFLKLHALFHLVHHAQWTPAKHKTDGFFLATFQRQ